MTVMRRHLTDCLVAVHPLPCTNVVLLSDDCGPLRFLMNSCLSAVYDAVQMPDEACTVAAAVIYFAVFFCYL